MAFGTLHITYAHGWQETVEIGKPTLKIGAAPDNDLVLVDPAVAPYHVQILSSADGVQILVVDPAAPVYVSGRLATPGIPEALADGATMEIDGVTLRFAGAAPMAVTPVASSARVSLNRASLVLDPGTRQLVTLTVENTGAAADRYAVVVDGWHDAWMRVSPRELPLEPGASGQLDLALQPPRTPEAVAQRGVVTVMVQSARGATVSTGQLQVEVRPFVAFGLAVAPAQAVGRPSAIYTVTVINAGNNAAVFDLTAYADNGNAAVALDAAQVSLRANDRGAVGLRVTPDPVPRGVATPPATITVVAEARQLGDRFPARRMQRVQAIPGAPRVPRWTVWGLTGVVLLIAACLVARPVLRPALRPLLGWLDQTPGSVSGSPGAPATGTPVTGVKPTPARGQVTILLENDRWSGARSRQDGMYDGRTASWIWGTGSGYHRMETRVQLNERPVGQARLVLHAEDDEAEANAAIRITVNNVEIFAGVTDLPDDPQSGSQRDGAWSDWERAFDSARLRKGDNTITIELLNPDPDPDASGPPFLMLDKAELIVTVPSS